tara:strand:- start:8333 stop:9982 length:1650 start_codon:yes stop_codon:yes gene_type:complete
MKIGLGQINTIVGDFTGNRQKIIESYKTLVEEGAQLVVFPELAVCGYPPRDLLFRSGFGEDNETSVELIAQEVGEVPLLVGYAKPNESPLGRRFFNAAAWCEKGKVKRSARKCLLPTYDVFDEDRFFEGSHKPIIIEHLGKKLGISICEDLWTDPGIAARFPYAQDPITTFKEEGADIILNLSASPWYINKEPLRESRFSLAAQRCNCPLVCANIVGANDALLFDGSSVAMDNRGIVRYRGPSFEEASVVIDLDALPEQPPELPKAIASVYKGLVVGIQDYVRKTNFNQVLIGLSGGIDSAVVAVLACKALGPENVIGVRMPSEYSSQHSKDDAATLAKALGITLHDLPIQKPVAAFNEALKPLFKDAPADLTEENLQARARGTFLMALANKWNALLLSTGNKSELAVGYCTLYGDMCGGLAPLSDVYKTTLYQLARYINEQEDLIPQNILDKPPSAELRPDQTDQDTLPDYEILDGILRRFIEEEESLESIINSGFDEAVVRQVCRWVDVNEYKRKQAALGIKITPKMLTYGRSVPIVHQYGIIDHAP